MSTILAFDQVSYSGERTRRRIYQVAFKFFGHVPNYNTMHLWNKLRDQDILWTEENKAQGAINAISWQMKKKY